MDNMYLSDRPKAYVFSPRSDIILLKSTHSNAAAEQSDEEEKLPFACLICRQTFTDPIVTRCGHYFCSQCAINRFAKTPKCFACGAPTGGLFNRADKILEKRDKALAAARLAEGIDSDEGEGGLDIEGLEEREATPEKVDVEQAVVLTDDDEEAEYFEEEEAAAPKVKRVIEREFVARWYVFHLLY